MPAAIVAAMRPDEGAGLAGLPDLAYGKRRCESTSDFDAPAPETTSAIPLSRRLITPIFPHARLDARRQRAPPLHIAAAPRRTPPTFRHSHTSGAGFSLLASSFDAAERDVIGARALSKFTPGAIFPAADNDVISGSTCQFIRQLEARFDFLRYATGLSAKFPLDGLRMTHV